MMHQMQVMAWSIHYKYRGAACYRSVSVFEIALDQACELLGEGADVNEVASSGGDRTIGADEIRRICRERAPEAPQAIDTPAIKSPEKRAASGAARDSAAPVVSLDLSLARRALRDAGGGTSES